MSHFEQKIAVIVAEQKACPDLSAAAPPSQLPTPPCWDVCQSQILRDCLEMSARIGVGPNPGPVAALRPASPLLDSDPPARAHRSPAF